MNIPRVSGQSCALCGKGLLPVGPSAHPWTMPTGSSDGAQRNRQSNRRHRAQIHAGGRGKGGGVKVVKTAEDASADLKIFGMQLVTHQTGPEGKKVGRLLWNKASTSPRSSMQPSCSIARRAAWS